MQENILNIIVYNDGELELKVSVENETIWLTQTQLCNIFEKDQSVLVGISIIFLKIMK